MEKFLQFVIDNKYPIIGFIVAIVLIATGLYKLIIPIALIIFGIYGGIYFQKNKEEVKEKELLLEISRVRINHNYCQCYYFINKRKIYECHFIVNEIVLNEEKQQFEFQLIEDERLWKYNNIIEARGNIVGKYYVPSNKKIVIDY